MAKSKGSLIGKDYRPFVEFDPFKQEYWRGLSAGTGIGFVAGLLAAGVFIAWMILTAPN